MSQRIQRVALGAALLAVALVSVALVVAIRRGGARSTPLIARPMHARDLATLSADTVERADEGVHVQPTVAAALGMSTRDTLIAISGRPITRPGELDTVLRDLQALHPTQWFVELVRDGVHVVERWDLDGDVAAARRDRSGGADPASDPLRATIMRVGVTRFELPRSTLVAWLAEPARLLDGVVLVRQLPIGLELHTVHPGTVVAALGLEDGDVIRALDGVEVASYDSLAAVAPGLRKASQVTLDVRRRGAPLLLNYTIR